MLGKVQNSKVYIYVLYVSTYNLRTLMDEFES